MPIKTAMTSEAARPENILPNKVVRFMGCETNSSINSAELYT